MLLVKPEVDKKQLYKNELKDCRIRGCSRKIIFFIDRTEYEAGTCHVGKAIQINLSMEEGTDMKSFGVMSPNSNTIKNAVYKYDVFFPYGPSSIDDASMILRDAYSTEEINDFDNRNQYRNDIGLYNKELSSDTYKMEAFNSVGKLFRTSVIPLPKYYTEEQQTKEEGDAYSIIWVDHALNYDAGDLIDPFTIVEFHDIKTYDTMIPFLEREIKEKSNESNNINSVNIISDLFIPTTECLLNGYTFIYDTQDGMNILSNKLTSIPFAEFRIKENMIANLQGMKDLVESEAKYIEKKYGSIRMYYVPLMSGDKLSIKYKDYANENQPGFNKTAIDKGYTIADNLLGQYNEVSNHYTSLGSEF
ncbi:MAG: hypothetical protein ACRC5M_06810 [Anaeroplasmataceae bacterium]